MAFKVTESPNPGPSQNGHGLWVPLAGMDPTWRGPLGSHRQELRKQQQQLLPWFWAVGSDTRLLRSAIKSGNPT